MKKIIKLFITNKATLVVLLLTLFCNQSYSQVFSNGTVTANITAENPFFDASSNFDFSIDPTNAGKGLLFPRMDLTTFTFNVGLLDGFTFPSAFDGMIVYNVATGNTPLATVQGVKSTAVTPGYYYFSNPNAGSNPSFTTNIAGGEWIRIANQNDIKSTPSGAILPTIPSPNPGDVFYNTTTKSLYYYKDTQWVPVSSTPSGTTTPAAVDSKVGDVFYVTNADPALNVLKIFNGTAWVTAGVALDATGENYLTLTGQTLKAAPIDLSGTNATGILAAGRFPALTGDITTVAGSLTTTLKSVGTAGTYKSVTTDAQGRVISGTNPTTLAGYGITDAATAAHTHALSSLTDVAVPSPTSGDVLQWNGSKWVNNAITTGNQSISFTPNAAGDVTGTATGTTSLTPTLVIGAGKVTNAMLAGGIDLTTKVTGVLPIANIPTTLTGITSLNGLQLTSLPTGFSISGGTASKTLTVTDNATLSGTNTGDQTASTVSINPITGVTGTTVQAALSDLKGQISTNSSDISTKLTANTAITGNTKTKITYDAKGLVTAGADATTADIAESTNKKYVTDAQSTALTNLSGTNTGDQTLSLAGSTLTLSGGGGSVTGIGDITGVVAGTGLSGGGTSGDVTLNLATNAVGAANLKGSSGSLDASGATTGFILQSNGDGTFSWKDITSGVAADPSSLSLGTGMFYIGDASSKASAISKTGIPLSGFGVAAADIDLGGYKITNLAAPTATTDAVTKKYVDDNKIDITSKGVANGVVPLDATNKIPDAFLPSSLLGAVVYQGTYDASSNTPALAAPAVGNKGYYYVVNTPGTQQGLSLSTGDWVISNGTVWSKVSSSSPVTAVFGRSGNIVANTGDYNTAQVTETTNLYYTDARVAANSTVIGKEDKTNKSTNVVTDGSSDIMYPSVKAVKTYVDAKVPASVVADNGKILTVNASGTPVWQALSSSGTVTTVSVTPNAGVTGVVTNPTTTPAIALTLGNITPTSVAATGTISAGGAITGSSLTTTGTVTGSNIPAGTTISGANTGDQQITLTGVVTGTGATKTSTIATSIGAGAITSTMIGTGTIVNANMADGSITPLKLKNIASQGTAGNVLTSDGTGGFAWGASAATNLTYTPTSTNATLASSTGTGATISAGSTSVASLMLPGDKSKLDGIAAGATNYVLPIASAGALGGIKVGANLSIDGTGTLSATSSGLSSINASSLLGNNTGSNAVPTALSVSDVKTLLSLTNVDNTTDANKPISTATQTALNLKQDVANISNTLATDASSTSKYPSVKAIKDYVDTQISTGIPSATTTSLGVVQLAGDLGGTALSPAVASVGGSAAIAVGTATVLANNATATNNASTIVRRDASGNFTAGTITANLSGNATTATTATNATNTAITNDVATATSVYPTWVTANSGNMPLKVSSSSLSFVPSTGTLTATAFSGSLNASNLASGSVPIARLGTAGGTASSTTYLRGDNTWATIVSGAGDMLLGSAQSVTALKTFDNSMLAMKGTSTGTTTITSANASTSSYILTLPAATGTVALSTSPLSQFAPTTSAQLAGIISDETGTGALVFANTPTFVTPALGAATATSVTATGNLSGNQLVSTVATGTAPLTVTSTTPVPNLSIGGNAATATNIAGGAGGQVHYQSAAGVTSLLPNGTSGQVLTSSGGTAAPIWTTPTAADATTTTKGVLMLSNDLGGTAAAPSVMSVGGASAANIRTGVDLANGATWSNPNTLVKRDASGTILSLDASQLTTGSVPSARFANGTVPVAAINTTGTASSTTFLRGDGVWATPTGGTGTTLPTPVMPADQSKVLTVDATGSAVWQASVSSGSTMVTYNPSGNTKYYCRASGTGVTVTLSGYTYTVNVPTGVWLDYLKIKSSYGDVGSQVNLDIVINYVGKEFNNNADLSDLMMPSIFLVDIPFTTNHNYNISSPYTTNCIWLLSAAQNGSITFHTASMGNHTNTSGDGFFVVLHF